MKKTKQIKRTALSSECITGAIMTDRASEILTNSCGHSAIPVAGKKHVAADTCVKPPVARICVGEEIMRLCHKDGCDYCPNKGDAKAPLKNHSELTKIAYETSIYVKELLDIKDDLQKLCNVQGLKRAHREAISNLFLNTAFLANEIHFSGLTLYLNLLLEESKRDSEGGEQDSKHA